MTSRLTRALAQLGRAGVDKLSASFDSWENNVTGFGTGDDKTTYTRFMGVMLLSQQELSNLYHGDDLAARMVDVVPDEMLREGFTVDFGDVGLNTAIADKLEELSIDERLANGIRWGRGFGEGAILIGADDGRSASQPLIPERARDISYLHVMDGRYYWPLSYYRDAGHPKLGQPETFGVMSPGYSGQPGAVVHETRLIRFGGAPTADQEREVNQSRDYSVLQRAYESLRAFNTGFKSVELLLTDGHQSVFKMQGLAEMIGSGGEAMAAARLKIINLYRSVLRAIVVDAGDKEGGVGAEDFTRNSVSFSDIPKTLDSFMLRLAAAVQIPVTILMGQSPAGMNATGESDFRWFYDRIRSEQTRKLAPKIRRLIRVLLATKNWQPKKQPAAITIKFPPLWSEAPLAAAQTRAAQMTMDAAGVTAGIWLPEEVALHRGKVDGYDTDIVLSDRAREVREDVLKDELQRLGDPEPPPGFGGGGFGRPAAKPSGDGAPPPLAKSTEDDNTNLDADDYERDEAGRFAETGGGGASSGGGGGANRVAVAQQRLSQAKERHAAAQAEHEAAKAGLESTKAEAHAKLEQRIADRQEAAKGAEKLANEAKAEIAKHKAEAKELAQQMRKIPMDEDGFSRDPEAYDKLDRQRDQALEAAAELNEHVSALVKEVKANAPTNPKIEQARSAIEAADARTLDKLESRDDNAMVRSLAPNTDAQVDYVLEKELKAEHGAGWQKISTEAQLAKQNEVWARFNGGFHELDVIGYENHKAERYEFPDFKETSAAKTEAKLARAARAVKAHEREVKRLSSKPVDADGDGRTGKSEEQDDKKS